MRDEKKSGPFIAFVLLERSEWDAAQCRTDLLADWAIACPAAVSDCGDSMTFETDGTTVTVRLISARIPAGEAEHNAATNYLWPQAAETAARHICWFPYAEGRRLCRLRAFLPKSPLRAADRRMSLAYTPAVRCLSPMLIGRPPR